MQSTEPTPKEFDKAAPILPLPTPGILTLGRFQQAHCEIHQLEYLKRTGLTDEEIKLYHDNEAGLISKHKKIESTILQDKLIDIYSKLAIYRRQNAIMREIEEVVQPSTSGNAFKELPGNLESKFYPDQHPMNSVKELEQDLFEHLKGDKVTPITKRRKILRRLTRKESNLDPKHAILNVPSANPNPNSLWDVKEVPKKRRIEDIVDQQDVDLVRKNRIIGPKRQTKYTIRDNRIVRLDPVARNQDNVDQEQEYRAVDIIVPVNQAEELLLEGTKLSVDEIRNMDRFKDYQPGQPSNVLFLKNISPAATNEDISILFNQFLHENRGPIHVRLMTGRLRGQAFVRFQFENVAIQALEDVNGTIVKGRPIIVQFGKNSNNIQNIDR